MTSTKKALIVHAHPEQQSFCTAQMREAAQTLQAEGYSTEILDLYRMEWNPVLSEQDFSHDRPLFFKPQAEQIKAVKESTLVPELQEQVNKLQQADLLIFSFPLWWFSVPAILKGWVDRVFVMGEIYGGEVDTYLKGRFRGRRALLLLTTGGNEASYGPEGSNGNLETVLFPLQHGMLHFVGFTVLAPVVTYGPAHLSIQECQARLEEVAQELRTLDNRTVVFP